MHELPMKQSGVWPVEVSSVDDGTSLPQRELLGFIDTVSGLIGTEPRSLLKEIWLDELACLDCMPEPSSSEWHLVTLAAFRRLAIRLIGMESDSTQLWGL
jgi:hypothetical protein